MTPTVVYYVIGLFALRSLAVAVLGPGFPGLGARKTRDLPEAVRPQRIRRLRWLNGVLAVLLVAMGFGLRSADSFLKAHAERRAARAAVGSDG